MLCLTHHPTTIKHLFYLVSGNDALQFSNDKPFTVKISVDRDDCESYPNENSSERCEYPGKW